MNEENKQENRTSPDADELFQELATSPAVQVASEVQKQLQDVTTSPVFLEIQKNLQALSSVTVSRPLQSAFDGVLASLKGLQDVLASIDPKKLEQLKEEARILAADMMNGATLTKIEKAKASFEYWTTKCDEAKASLEQFDKKTRKPYTKKAFVLDVYGERADGFNFKKTAVLDFDGTIYKPTKAERYILDGYVYYNASEKDEQHANEVSALAKRTLSFDQYKRFSELRSVELVLYYFGLNLNNDVWLLLELQKMFDETEKKKDKTDEEKEAAENLRQMIDVHRLTCDTMFEAAEEFMKAHNVPEFLTFGVILFAKKLYLERVPPKLLDPLKNSANAKERARMFGQYLNTRFESFGI